MNSVKVAQNRCEDSDREHPRDYADDGEVNSLPDHSSHLLSPTSSAFKVSGSPSRTPKPDLLRAAFGYPSAVLLQHGHKFNWKPPPILQVNRQIRDEVRLICYSETNFRFYNLDDNFPRLAVRWARSVEPSNLADIKRVTIRARFFSAHSALQVYRQARRWLSKEDTELVNKVVFLNVKTALTLKLDRVCCKAGQCYKRKASRFGGRALAVHVVNRRGAESIALDEYLEFSQKASQRVR